MNTEQTRIADILLQKIDESNGMFNMDMFNRYLVKEGGANPVTACLVRDQLINENLISWWGNERYRLQLTRKGEQAAVMGVTAYFKKKDEENILPMSNEIYSGTYINNQTVISTAPEKKSIYRSIGKHILIPLFVAIVGGVIIIFLTQWIEKK